jgi:hypothetical protein
MCATFVSKAHIEAVATRPASFARPRLSKPSRPVHRGKGFGVEAEQVEERDTEWVTQLFFLEANPSGQFLFVEVDTGQLISRAFAELLLAA